MTARRLVLLVIVGMLVNLAGSYIGAWVAGQLFPDNAVLAATIIMDLMVAAYAVFAMSEIGGLRRTGGSPTAVTVIVALAVFVVYWIAGTCASTWVWLVMYDAGSAGYGEASASMGVAYIVMSIAIAPVVEEMLFRGVAFGALSKTKVGIMGAAIISSLLFALAHQTIMHLAPTFMLGMLCCWADTRWGNIVPGIVLHMLSNTVTVAFMGTPMPNFMATGTFSMVSTGIVVGLLVAMFIHLERYGSKTDMMMEGVSDGAEQDDAELS